jgi:hypothetical protein
MNEQIPKDLAQEDLSVQEAEELEFPVKLRRRSFLRVFGLGAATLPFSYTIYDAGAQERLGEVSEATDLKEVKGMTVHDLGEPVKFEDGLTYTPLYGKGGGLILLEVSRIRADREGTALGIQQTMVWEGFTVTGDEPFKHENVVSIPFVVDRKNKKVYPLSKDDDGKPFIEVDGRIFRVAGYLGVLKKNKPLSN